MSDILQEISQGIQEIFSDIGTLSVTPAMELGEIPDWDSMSSVNFQMFLERHFGVTVAQDLLAEGTTIQEVIDIIMDLQKAKISA